MIEGDGRTDGQMHVSIEILLLGLEDLGINLTLGYQVEVSHSKIFCTLCIPRVETVLQ